MKTFDTPAPKAHSPYLRQVGTLTLPLAMHALQAALDRAGELSLRISVSVVDAAGSLIHLAHMDGATLQSRDIALNKALTAVGFGFSTSAWEARLESRSAAVRQGLPLQPRIALFGGGEPFLHGGAVLGAIGVSGASEAEDVLCAQAAAQAVEHLLEATSPQ